MEGRAVVGSRAGTRLTPLPANTLAYEDFKEAYPGGRVLSREHLLNRVWGYAHADEIESRTVDVHIRRLRAKLGAEGRRIATLKGVGYRFEAE
jgi:hypothetical protein